MALTRKMLKGMGLNDEQVEAVIEGHNETIEGLKSGQQKPQSQEKTKEEPEKKPDGEDWKAKYEKLVADNEARTARETKTAALKALITSEDSHLSEKGQKKVLKYTSLDDIELDSSGKIKGAKKLLEELTDEWSEYVTAAEETGTETKGKDGASAASSGGASKKMTKEEIMKIPDAGTRQQAIADNHELFGF